MSERSVVFEKRKEVIVEKLYAFQEFIEKANSENVPEDQKKKTFDMMANLITRMFFDFDADEKRDLMLARNFRNAFRELMKTEEV